MILNLVYPDKSDIKFKISEFPDGQQTVTLIDFHPATLAYVPVEIKSRLNSFKDLELIICANQALRNNGVKVVSLYVPYFTGARSDRKFENGGVNYLKQVICPIINSQYFKSVTVMDPHSDVLEACLNNFSKIDNIKLVDEALSYLIKENEERKVALVSPDAGALKKIYDVAKHFDITNVTTASKVRDITTGNILRTELPVMDLDGIEHIIIIDDICDGGRTFIELAKEIRKQTDKPIYLIVTHGIFSASFYELAKHIEGIYSTNSVSDIDVESHSDYTVGVKYLKQLNIF
jgi:ribose-phosphate pyrophosphokinase